jgi:hypothetical protein
MKRLALIRESGLRVRPALDVKSTIIHFAHHAYHGDRYDRGDR